MEISYLSIGGVALYNGIAHCTLCIWTKTETIEEVYDYAMYVHMHGFSTLHMYGFIEGRCPPPQETNYVYPRS